VRMLAYSGIAQAGYMLAPLAIVGQGPQTTVGTDVNEFALHSIVTYLVIYAFMNLGAFGVVIAAARKTRSGDIDSMGGLLSYAPGLTVAMTIFMFSLAGIPPLGGWYAKFGIFAALTSANSTAGYAMALVVGVNSVIALFYYARVAKVMWMDPVPDDDRTPIRVPPAIRSLLAITAVITLAIGVYPEIVTHFSDSTCLAAAPASCDVAAGR
jgi:NADH-quinone oxidoreductase subunit N